MKIRAPSQNSVVFAVFFFFLLSIASPTVEKSDNTRTDLDTLTWSFNYHSKPQKVIFDSVPSFFVEMVCISMAKRIGVNPFSCPICKHPFVSVSNGKNNYELGFINYPDTSLLIVNNNNRLEAAVVDEEGKIFVAQGCYGMSPGGNCHHFDDLRIPPDSVREIPKTIVIVVAGKVARYIQKGRSR